MPGWATPPPQPPPGEPTAAETEALARLAEKPKHVRREEFQPCLGGSCKGTGQASIVIADGGLAWVVKCECRGVRVCEPVFARPESASR